MKDWKTVAKKLLSPPARLTVLLVLLCTAALVAVFIKGWEESAVAYITYPLSFYTLCVISYKAVFIVPVWYRAAKRKFYDHPYGNKYMTDIGYKVRVSLYISLGINLVYSVFKLVSGILYSSFWWGAMAVYYMILSVIRFLLLRYMRSDEQHIASEWRRYRLCGILMVLLNLSLTGIVFQMVWQNKAFIYPEVIIIASATYTFYTVTVSIIDIIKYRQYQSPVMSASKAIRFAAALVSVLTPETAMLAQYGEDEAFRRVMTAATGGGVCVIVLAMSVYMIVKACKELKKETQAYG